MFKQSSKHDASTNASSTKTAQTGSEKTSGGTKDEAANKSQHDDAPPMYTPPQGAAPHNHTNIVIEAARIRARDEVSSMSLFPGSRVVSLTSTQQEMQQALLRLQYQYRIFNSDIEPEHDSDYPCNCAIHQYKARKAARFKVQDMWSKAVMYPGELLPSGFA